MEGMHSESSEPMELAHRVDAASSRQQLGQRPGVQRRPQLLTRSGPRGRERAEPCQQSLDAYGPICGTREIASQQAVSRSETDEESAVGRSVMVILTLSAASTLGNRAIVEPSTAGHSCCPLNPSCASLE